MHCIVAQYCHGRSNARTDSQITFFCHSIYSAWSKFGKNTLAKKFDVFGIYYRPNTLGVEW